MPDDQTNAKDTKATETQTDANTLILGGLGIGAFGVISAAIGGAVCPVCVVAAPALLGIGAYKRWKAAKRPPSTR
jgi:hypothetical protein